MLQFVVYTVPAKMMCSEMSNYCSNYSLHVGSWCQTDVMCCYYLAVDPVRMPPVLVLLVLWGGRLWISHPWGGWTRPSTSSPLVPGRALSGTSKPLLSALQMSWSTLPRAHPIGIYVFWLHLGCFFPMCEWIQSFNVMLDCAHSWLFLLQLRHQEEGRDWACCQGQPLSGACILVHLALELLCRWQLFWFLFYLCLDFLRPIQGFALSEQWKLLRTVVVWGLKCEVPVPGLSNPSSFVIFLFYSLYYACTLRWLCLNCECCVGVKAVG